MTTAPEVPASPSPATTSAAPTPAVAPPPAPPRPTSTVTVTSTTSETVQVVPSPLKIDDGGGMDVSDWTAIGSLLTTLILLWVTAKTLRANQTMADKAEASAEASLSAARAAQESAAITAAEVDLVIDAEPQLQDVGLFLEQPTVGEKEAHQRFLTARGGMNQIARSREWQQLVKEREARNDEVRKTYYETPSGHRLWLKLTIGGASVIVHRVVLVEHPGTRDPWGRANGLEGPPEPEAYWGLRPSGSVPFPLPVAKGEKVWLRTDYWWDIRPDTALKFIARNWLVVEYSFGADAEKRIARANWGDVFMMKDEVAGEEPVGAPVLTLPAVLTNEKTESTIAPTADSDTGSGESAAPSGRDRIAGALRRLADRVDRGPRTETAEQSGEQDGPLAADLGRG